MKRTITIIFIIIFLLPLSKIIFAQADNDSDVQEVVEERLQSAQNRLKAFIGTVTEKTDDTLQLENDKNEIKLISISEDTSFTRTTSSVGSLDFEDIGIGDYIISMGTLDENNVLTAQRIVVTSAPEEIESSIFFATITSVEDEIIAQSKSDAASITLDLNTGYSITFTDEDGSTSQTRLSSLYQGDEVILIGVMNDEGELETNRIHITQSASEED